MSRLIPAFEQFFDSSGNPLENGLVDFFEPGSSSVRKTTYADSGETMPNANPVILNGDGRCPNVFGAGTYRAVLKESNGNQILYRDPIGGDQNLAFGADWSSIQIYGTSDVVRDAGEYWESLANNNLNNRPSIDDGSNWRNAFLTESEIVNLSGKVYGTVAAAKADPLYSAGQKVATQGYYTAGGGGEAGYIVVAIADYVGTPDGYGDHATDDGGFVLVLQVDNSVHVNKFGCVADLDVAGMAATTDAPTIAAFIAAATDNLLPLTAALNHAIKSHRTLEAGAGGYYTSARIIPTMLTNDQAFQNRAGNVKIKGQGITNTAFYTDAAQYIFDLTSGVTGSIDIVEVTDCMLWSPNGGGITTPDGMWRRYARVFFHGAAAGFYGRFDNGDAGAAYGVYMLDEEDCIYWNRHGYFGGAFSVNNFHTFNSKNAFISQNRYDGDVCKLEDGKSVSIPSIVFEAVPNGATPSSQAFLNLAGTTISADIGTMYVEGVWNRVIRNGSAADKNINIEMIYAWQRDISSFGDPECRIYSGQSSDAVNINKILYIADSTIAAPSTSMYLIEDNSIDDSRVSVNRFENQTAAGGQATRELKANVNAHRYNKGGFRSSKHIGATANPGFAFNLDGPGAYIVNINFVSIDRNHGGTESFIVTYDDASANDFTNVVSIAAIAVKSGQFTSMAVTVDSAGLVTVTSVGLSQDWNVFYSVNILSALPLVNGTA